MQCLDVSNECCMGDNQLRQSTGCVPVNIARMLLAFFVQGLNISRTVAS